MEGEEIIKNRKYEQEKKPILLYLSFSVLMRRNLAKAAVWVPGDGMRGH